MVEEVKRFLLNLAMAFETFAFFRSMRRIDDGSLILGRRPIWAFIIAPKYFFAKWAPVATFFQFLNIVNLCGWFCIVVQFPVISVSAVNRVEWQVYPFRLAQHKFPFQISEDPLLTWLLTKGGQLPIDRKPCLSSSYKMSKMTIK